MYVRSKKVAEEIIRAIDWLSNKEGEIAAERAKVYCWPQTWTNTSCGFGGIAGQAITEANTIVLGWGSMNYVFHSGRFAYEVNLEKDKFREYLEDFKSRCLAGAKNRDRYYHSKKESQDSG